MDDQAATRRAHGLPSLPPEVLQVVVGYLALPASEGDASAVQTLLRLSAVNTTCREWALEALYTVLILPRHVREFRKWYQRMRTASPPFPCAGYVRALFMAIDDVTRLTTSSAGWEAEMLRLLHYCGPTITHLSLWQAESRALLRDAAQAHGSRFARDLQPAWAVGEGDLLHQWDAPQPQSNGRPPSPPPEQPEPDMPRWLRAELASAPAEQVAKRHAPHFFVHHTEPSPRQWRRRPHPRACTPTHLSLVMSYPIFENERPDLFANLVIWSRVEELDVYVR